MRLELIRVWPGRSQSGPAPLFLLPPMQLLQREEETFPDFIQTFALLSSLKITITTTVIRQELKRTDPKYSKIQTMLRFIPGEGSGHASVCPFFAAKAWMLPQRTPGSTWVRNPFCFPTVPCIIFYLLP